jgi:hypothetical protein
MLPDNMNAALLFTLLVTILKSSDSEHEQLFIYESLREGIVHMPDAFPVVYDILVPKMALVMQNSQNQQIIDACLAIMQSMFKPDMQNSKKRLNKDYVHAKLGFQGLIDSDTFSVPHSLARACRPIHTTNSTTSVALTFLLLTLADSSDSETGDQDGHADQGRLPGPGDHHWGLSLPPPPNPCVLFHVSFIYLGLPGVPLPTRAAAAGGVWLALAFIKLLNSSPGATSDQEQQERLSFSSLGAGVRRWGQGAPCREAGCGFFPELWCCGRPPPAARSPSVRNEEVVSFGRHYHWTGWGGWHVTCNTTHWCERSMLSSPCFVSQALFNRISSACNPPPLSSGIDDTHERAGGTLSWLSQGEALPTASSAVGCASADTAAGKV